MLRLLLATATITLTCLTSGTALAADPNGAGATGGTANPNKTTPRNYTTLSIKNSCPHPVQVGVYFKDRSDNWQTKAWYAFKPNETNRLNGVETRNRYLYYYAETTDDSGMAWTGNSDQLINNRLYPLQEINTGSIARWTQTLTCNDEDGSEGVNAKELNKSSINKSKSKSGTLLAQAAKQPGANQQALDELPPPVSSPASASVDAPKNEAAAPANPKGLPPAKGNVDSAEQAPAQPASDSNPSPSPKVTPSPTDSSTPAPTSERVL
jgi:uncharacterized membrane protein